MTVFQDYLKEQPEDEEFKRECDTLKEEFGEIFGPFDSIEALMEDLDS